MQRLGNCTKKVAEPYTLIQGPHPPVNKKKQRHATENITFPQLRRFALNVTGPPGALLFDREPEIALK